MGTLDWTGVMFPLNAFYHPYPYPAWQKVKIGLETQENTRDSICGIVNLEYKDKFHQEVNEMTLFFFIMRLQFFFIKNNDFFYTGNVETNIFI